MVGFESWLSDKELLASRLKQCGGSVISNPLPYYKGRTKVAQLSNQFVLIATSPLRTKKYLMALALGIPVVSSTWIAHCLEGNKTIDFNVFRLSNGDSKILGSSVAAIPSKEGILKGKRVYSTHLCETNN
jgi:hypothetical protein